MPNYNRDHDYDQRKHCQPNSHHELFSPAIHTEAQKLLAVYIFNRKISELKLNPNTTQPIINPPKS